MNLGTKCEYLSRDLGAFISAKFYREKLPDVQGKHFYMEYEGVKYRMSFEHEGHKHQGQIRFSVEALLGKDDPDILGRVKLFKLPKKEFERGSKLRDQEIEYNGTQKKPRVLLECYLKSVPTNQEDIRSINNALWDKVVQRAMIGIYPDYFKYKQEQRAKYKQEQKEKKKGERKKEKGKKKEEKPKGEKRTRGKGKKGC